MSQELKKRMMRTTILAAAIMALACSSPALAGPSYSYLTTLAIPGGTFTGYDLATFDNTTQLFYLTDRSNNGIDVYSAKTNAFVERIGSGLFSGATPSNDNAGPNGISISDVAGGKLLLAGNGASNLLSFNLDTAGLNVVGTPRTISSAVTGVTPVPPNRVDGVAFSPTANTILAANNASTPGFVTLIDNATGAITKTILLNGTGGYPDVGGNGVEATIFNTKTGTFFVAVPALNAAGTGAGGVIELDAKTGALLNTFDFNALGLSGVCSPTGLVQGGGGSMLVACSDGTAGHSVILDPATKKLTLVNGISGGDQVTYDPATDQFIEAARFQLVNGVVTPQLGIIDASTLSLQVLPIGANDHGVAVDAISGKIFVPTAKTNAYPGCTTGCILVFAQAVPEPATWSLMGLAMLGLAFVKRRFSA